MTSTSAYDPTKPVTIHNPLPQDQWPIKKGRKVVYINPKWNGGTVAEESGTIRWYNPALETTCTTSKGHPFFTINIRGDENRSHLVSVNHVFPDTKAGRLSLKKLKAQIYRDRAKQNREQSAKLLRKAKQFEAEAVQIERHFS